MPRLLSIVVTAALIVSSPAIGRGEGEGKIDKTTVKIETAVRPSDVIVNFALLPLAFAFALPHGGFTRYPYENGGYTTGERDLAVAFTSSRQELDDGHQATHAHFRVRGGNRLGWDASVSAYDPGVFSKTGAKIWSGHVTASYIESHNSMLEAGYGIASYQEPRPRTGFSFELNYEVFPVKPFTFGARYQGASLHGQGFHDLSCHVGAAWKWVGVELGYRAFYTPIFNEFGPELGVNFWF